LAGKSIHFQGTGDYLHIDTGGADDSPDGAMKRRKHPHEPVVNYVGVDSVDMFADKIAKLGGQNLHGENRGAANGVLRGCQDTEGNTFGIWESDPNAK
jgi:predicted enzyme related to lactoylglutathione lyase